MAISSNFYIPGQTHNSSSWKALQPGGVPGAAVPAGPPQPQEPSERFDAGHDQAPAPLMPPPWGGPPSQAGPALPSPALAAQQHKQLNDQTFARNWKLFHSGQRSQLSANEQRYLAQQEHRFASPTPPQPNLPTF